MSSPGSPPGHHNEDESMQDNFADDTIPDFITFSPPHARVPDVVGGDEIPEGGSSFARAFPGIQPHPVVDMSRARVSPKLKGFWASKVPDELKQFMVSADDVFKPVCMTPTPELLKTMCAKSKCMELLSQDDERLLYLPTYGSTMCFIAMGGAGELPEPIQEVLYFFGQVANSMGNFSPYVVPTETVDLVVDRSDPKIITGLTSTGEGLEPRAPKRRRNNDRGGFVTITDILAKRALDGSGEVKKVVHGITIHVGNAGVVFKNKDGDGQEQREIFTIAMVTVAENMAIWAFIEGKFLQRPPKHNNPKYEEMLQKSNALRFILKKITRYEIFHNMGILAEDFGMPEDYGKNPDNPLGPNTVFSMFQLPYKIFHMIEQEYSDADMSTLKITGFPEMGFTEDDLVSSEMESFMLKSIKVADMRDCLLMSELTRYAGTKDKSAFDSAILGAIGGWPLEVDESGNVLSYGLPPLPLMHSFDPQDICGSGGLTEFVARIGGPDGALPELSRAYMSAFRRGSSTLNTRPDVEHCISDKRLADPVTVLNHYYGGGVDVFQPLVVVGRHKVGHDALKAEIKSRREKGESPGVVAVMYENYLGDILQKLHDSISAGVFRSDTVTQMLMIHTLLDYDEISKKSIGVIMRNRSEKIKPTRQYDSMYRAWYVFLDVWQQLNDGSFLLNAGNLVCAIEVLISQLMFKFAGTNETWTFFFATVLVMSGNGHFQVSTANGVFQDTRKANSTGLDYTLARIIDIWTSMYNRWLIAKNKRSHIPLNCARFTESVLKNITNATAAGNRLLTVPSSRTNFQVMYVSEMRQSAKSLVQFGPARGEANGETGSFNSREREDKLRELAEELKVGTAAFTCVATNEKPNSEEGAEVSKTLGVVCAALPAGVPPPLPIAPIEAFNDKHTNTKGGRHRTMSAEMKDMAGNFLAYTQNFAGLCALTNLTGATSIEINPTSASFYDWVCHYVFQYTSTILDSFVAESFNRMKEGYKSREVVFNVWLKSISVLSQGKGREEAARHLLLDLGADPLPIVSVPSAACGLLYRGVHMPSLIVTKVFMKHTWEQGHDGAVPIIEWKNLNRFFSDEVAPSANDPDGGYVRDYGAIKAFVAHCIRHNRFCPDDESGYDPASNISCYISDNANGDLTPADTRTSMFRLLPCNGKDKEDLRDLPQRVALRLHSVFGGDLFRDCHMGPESSVLKNALIYILDKKFRPDFRGLISPKVFRSRDNLHKLGFLQRVQGMRDYTSTDAPPYARQFVCKIGNEVRSQGIGFNIWSLLVMNSLFKGSDPFNAHPSVSHVFSNNLMSLILANAPPGATPGDTVPLRCFDDSAHAVELHIPLASENNRRPEHFWRPNEKSFMETGILTVAGGIGKLLPEDYLHIPGHSAVAQRYCCSDDILSTPPESYKSSLNLQPDCVYSFVMPHKEDHFGFLEVSTENKNVQVEVWRNHLEPDPVSANFLDFYEWEKYLQDQKILLTPLITRLGVAVLVDTGSDSKVMGCLVPLENNPTKLFDCSTFTYQALIKSDMTIVKVFFTDLLKHAMIAVGEVMYLNMEVLEDPVFQAQGAGGKLLYTRLTVPNIRCPEIGKLYVSCLRRPLGYRMDGGPASETMLTIAVNPWDVQVASGYAGPPENIIKHLV